MKFITISYCTKGAYEALSLRLKESLEKLNIEHELKVIDTLGSWQKNCMYKAIFIKEMISKYSKPILFVDADAIFYRYPSLIETLDVDFAVHYFKDRQLASGTLYFNNSSPALDLLEAWISYNNEHPNEWDQSNLQNVVETLGWKYKLKMSYLPPEYCKIFDLTKDVQNPIIEHYQASRRLKNAS
jgi:hypothetical protein